MKNKKKIISGGAFLIEEILPVNIFTPEDFSKIHKMIYSATTDFVRKEILPIIDEIDTKNEKLSRKLLIKTGEIGLNGTDIPEEYGGENMDKVSTCLVTEAMGAAGSFSITHSIHTGIGMLPIAYFGSHDQKQKYLPKLCSGEWIGAYCLTEPNAGSDALNSQTTATLSDDGKYYFLNGEKIYITNGSWADCYAVYAKVDGRDFTGFIVEKDFEGFERGAEEKKMGLTGSSTCTIVLNNCKVPKSNVLYERGKGHKIAFNILNMGRYKIGANAVGGSKAAIAAAAQHAATRVQFGKSIGSFGMIKNKIANMTMRTYMAESMIYRLAAMIDDRSEGRNKTSDSDGSETIKDIEEYAAECSIIKVYGSECLDFCVDEWVQILGGAGYTADYPAEKAYRNSRINRIVEGTNEINRLLVPQTFYKRYFQGRLELKEAVKDIERQLSEWDHDILKLSETPLALEMNLIKMSKKMAIIAFDISIETLGKSFSSKQFILEILSNIMIEIFAMESGLLRALKIIENKGLDKSEYHIGVTKAYIFETFYKIGFWAKQVLHSVCQDDMLKMQLKKIEILSNHNVGSTISSKEKIADRVIKLKKYIY